MGLGMPAGGGKEEDAALHPVCYNTLMYPLVCRPPVTEGTVS